MGDNIKKALIEEYWLKKLAGEFPKIRLPFICASKEKEEQIVNKHPFYLEIPSSTAAKLTRAAKNSDMALFTLLLTGLSIVLKQYAGVDDLIVGTVPPAVAGSRNSSHVVFCRNLAADHMTIKEIITRTGQEVLEVMRYAQYPLDDVLETLMAKNDNGHLAMFNTAFILEPLQEKVAALEKFDWLFILAKDNGKLTLQLECPSALYDYDGAWSFGRNLICTLERMLENPTQQVALLDIISPEEKERLLHEFNGTEIDYPQNKTIHQLFAEQVERTPDRIALVGAGPRVCPLNSPVQPVQAVQPVQLVRLTYRQLNEQSTRLAGWLAEKGVQPDNIVGIKIARSVEMLIGILGILKSGGAYLPIDPDYPPERIDYMLKDSNAKICISVLNFQFVSNFEFRAANFNSSNLAYLIYTSGSTGKPKGVMIEHRSVINFIKGITDIIPFQESDRILTLTTICFDIFGLETMLPLTKGAAVIIGSEEEQQDAGLSAQVMEREAITLFQATPSRLQLLIQHPGAKGSLKRLKYLLVGGEVLPEALLAKLEQRTGAGIYNVYGPTETTIWSTIKKVGGGQSLNIGKPLANTFIYMLSRGGMLQPVGVAGEICIAGAGVARGYANRPELTAEKFPDRRYCTGDIGKWLADGNIECLGRIDHQVKLRGFRIELGEIEKALATHHDIKEAVVVIAVDDEHKSNYLCAYIVGRDKLELAALREYLGQQLPEYMIPSYFVNLEKIPLTASGKVDRNALPDPGGNRLEDNAQYLPPQNEVEKELAGIWEKVLKREKVGIDQNFFALGGDSVKSIQIISRMSSAGYTMEMKDLFQYPIIAKLAPRVKKLLPSPEQSATTTGSDFVYKDLAVAKLDQLTKQYAIEDIYILSPMQEGKLFYTFINESYQGGCMQISLRISGKINVALFESSMNEVFKRYDILRAMFIYQGVKTPIQIILKERQVDFLYKDLRNIVTADNKQLVIDELAQKDRKRAFDLSKDVLMRVTVAHIEAAEYEITWSFHHILMDGWCIGILFSDFLEIYHSCEENRPPRLPGTRPFKNYIQWLLKQDNEEAGRYWEKYLAGYDKATGMPKKKELANKLAGAQKDYRYERISFRLSKEKSTVLHALATKHQVTLNTVIQAIWGIILGKYNEREDMVFGAVVSGRPPQIPGIESMVGLFINTVPVRITYEPGMTFRELLVRVQEQALASEPYHHYPLGRIQAGNILKQDLLDHIMVFENYPLAEQVAGIAGQAGRKTFEIKGVSEYTQPDYNFHVVIQPHYALHIQFRFNALVYDLNFMEKLGPQIEEVIDTIIVNNDIRLKDINVFDERSSVKSPDWNHYTEDFDF